MALVWKGLIILFHLVVIINYILFLIYSKSVEPILAKLWPERAAFGGSLKYLTRWNVWLQLMYFVVAFINDIFGSESKTKEHSSGIQKIRDFVFASVAFPTGLFVTALFWSIYFVDRNLIWPVEIAAYYPPITNHMMHTTPLVSQIFELLFLFHIQPKRLHGLRYNDYAH